jgi:dTDP-4-amino-4,6-dideoxygalactose transaminase
VLQAENVLARRYFYPGAHQMEPYQSYFPHARLLLPETERLTQRVMSLPTGTAVSVQDVEKIGAIIEAAIAQRAEILEALK